MLSSDDGADLSEPFVEQADAAGHDLSAPELCTAIAALNALPSIHDAVAAVAQSHPQTRVRALQPALVNAFEAVRAYQFCEDPLATPFWEDTKWIEGVNALFTPLVATPAEVGAMTGPLATAIAGKWAGASGVRAGVVALLVDMFSN